MKKYNMLFVLLVLAASSLIWTSASFAAAASTKINVEGLTLEEAAHKYGLESGSDHPVIFEVNAELGPESCGLIIAAGCLKTCPTTKIFYQSDKLIQNPDGTRTMRVDVYHDVNEVAMTKSDTCNV